MPFFEMLDAATLLPMSRIVATTPRHAAIPNPQWTTERRRFPDSQKPTRARMMATPAST